MVDVMERPTIPLDLDGEGRMQKLEAENAALRRRAVREMNPPRSYGAPPKDVEVDDLFRVHKLMKEGRYADALEAAEKALDVAAPGHMGWRSWM